jgi:hypothetical protein
VETTPTLTIKPERAALGMTGKRMTGKVTIGIRLIGKRMNGEGMMRVRIVGKKITGQVMTEVTQIGRRRIGRLVEDGTTGQAEVSGAIPTTSGRLRMVVEVVAGRAAGAVTWIFARSTSGQFS